MLLVVDIGNTNITLGLFDKEEFCHEFRLPSGKEISQQEYENLLIPLLDAYFIEDCVIASVVDGLGEKIKAAIDNLYNIDSLFVTNKLDIGVSIIADNPEEVGADRIANAVAVSNMYDGAVIVIDFGTATTFDVVNSKKEFCGGIIAPGIKTQLKSLCTSTSKLPEFEPEFAFKVLGTSTKEAIMAGVIRGSGCMADGLIEQCESELGEKAQVVVTGGYGGMLRLCMKHSAENKPILTLQGIKDIYYRNRK